MSHLIAKRFCSQATLVTHSRKVHSRVIKELHLLLLFACGFSFSAMAGPPSNDDFTNRIVLTGSRITTSATILGATSEENDPPAHQNSPPREHTVWWTWIAPADGVVNISVDGSDFYAEVDVFTGATVGNLQQVSMGGWGFILPRFAFVRVSAGVAYQILVDGPIDPAISLGRVVLNLAFSPRPANDDFAHRIALTGENIIVVGTNTAASVEPFEERAVFNLGRSIWWSWTAPAGGPFTIGVEASPSNSEALKFGEYASERAILYILLGDQLTNATVLTNRLTVDRIDGRGPAQVTINAVAGTTYQIGVDGGVDLFGWLTLRIARTLPPLAVITGPPNDAQFISGTTVEATAEATDPDGSVANVEFTITDFYLHDYRVYRDGSGPFRVSIPALPPSRYYLRARATDNLGATADAAPVAFDVRPVNDAFARRLAFAGSSVTVTGTLANASFEPGDPLGEGMSTVWWSWTAPGSGPFTLSAESASAFQLTLAVFAENGSRDDVLISAQDRPVVWSGSSARLTLNATAGLTYAITVATGAPANADRYTLRVTPSVPPSVRLTSPGENDFFLVDQSVLFTVDAADADGSVRRVDYLLDDFYLLSSSTNAPFTFSHAFDVGNAWHRVRALAYDDADLVTWSEDVVFEVRYPGPPNDRFAERISFTGSFISVTGSTAHATLESNEQLPGMQDSAWWVWTAPETGPFVISVQSEVGYWPSLAVFTGATLSGLMLVTNSQFSGSDNSYQTHVTIEALAGVAYSIAVSAGDNIKLSVIKTLPPVVELLSPTNDTRFLLGQTIIVTATAEDPDGTIGSVEFFLDGWTSLGRITNRPYTVALSTLNREGYHRIHAKAYDNHGVSAVSGAVGFFVSAPGPANDNFADRISFTGLSVSITGATDHATREMDEPFWWWEGSAWWAWTAPASGAYTISVITEFGSPPRLAVYSGSNLAELTLVADNFSVDEGSFLLRTRVVIEAEAGMTYPIAVEGSHHFILSVIKSRPPSVTIVSPGTSRQFLTGEPINFRADAFDPDGTVQRVEFLLDESEVIGVVTNAPFSVIRSFSTERTGHRVRARAIDDAGLTTSSATVWFNVLYPPPINDDFVNRLPLGGTIVAVEAGLHNSTLELADPQVTPGFRGSSTWWTWRAPASGPATVTAANGAALVAVFLGSRLDELVPLATASTAQINNPFQLRFDAIGGTDYQIGVFAPDWNWTISLALFLDARELRQPIMARDDLFSFDLHTTVERAWIIQVSTNLLDWSPVIGAQSIDGTIRFFDPNVSQFPRRFYRAMSMEEP